MFSDSQIILQNQVVPPFLLLHEESVWHQATRAPGNTSVASAISRSSVVCRHWLRTRPIKRSRCGASQLPSEARPADQRAHQINSGCAQTVGSDPGFHTHAVSPFREISYQFIRNQKDIRGSGAWPAPAKIFSTVENRLSATSAWNRARPLSYNESREKDF